MPYLAERSCKGARISAKELKKADSLLILSHQHQVAEESSNLASEGVQLSFSIKSKHLTLATGAKNVEESQV